MTSHAGGRAFAGGASSRDCNCASLCLLLIVGQVTYVSFSSSLFQSVPCTPPNVDTRMRRSSNMKNRRTDRQTDGDSDRLMVDGATSFFTSIGCVVVVASSPANSVTCASADTRAGRRTLALAWRSAVAVCGKCKLRPVRLLSSAVSMHPPLRYYFFKPR